ncbi:MAG: xanthine dehydrogenase family protein molybdopterin-binding subunit, partial [Planctomycetales bacterium]|nr:xanthine dehydrogenase family protein molybdopterin-binding subunit [Planctomycetales bacterium]
EVAVEAARLAQAVARPVCLQWSREEEFTWAYFRPAARIEVTAKIDANQRIGNWQFTNYNAGTSALQCPYRTASGQTQFVPSDSPLRQGSYRALASTVNTFARESMMDELALAAQQDPLAFRLAQLDTGRLRDVLVVLSDRCQWTDRKQAARQAGRGMGLACGTEKGSFVAACAEVEVRDGEFRVLSICQVFECGAIQNPDNLLSQVEGAIIMGLGGALFEAIHIRNGRIENGNFTEYHVPRLKHVPQLKIHLLNRTDLPSVGAGETPIIAVAPAIANAIADASRIRIRSLPLRTESLRCEA